MAPTRQGSFRLFRFAGIDVFLHWSWFLVAVLQINAPFGRYSATTWNVLEYVALFGIVLMHEFGHALACRSVGGKAHQIVLWPLGGVAYVSPPPRPGATLWSIAAGPLVNVALVPVLTVFLFLGAAGWSETMPNAYAFVASLWRINLGLLIFNLMPIYPLDGGQILQAVLWFFFGRARSLLLATIIGFVGAGGLVVLAVVSRFYLHANPWIAIMAVFILLNCWGGLMQARFLARAAKLPRRAGYACPACKSPPIIGALWRCARCQKTFDTFETMAVCPHCGTQYGVTHCFECGNARPIQEWVVQGPPPVPPWDIGT